MTAGSPDQQQAMRAALAREEARSLVEPAPRVRLVADLVCPWCYIAFVRLRRAVAGSAAQLTWNPFLLNPNLPPRGVSRTQYLERRFGGLTQAHSVHRRVALVGAREGIPFAFGAIRAQPNTVSAHGLVLAAAAHGRQIEAAAALFHAFFADGVDIGSPAALMVLGRQLGLSDEEIARAQEPATARTVLEAHERAFGLGIAGVPVTVFGTDHLIAGAQPSEVLAALLDLDRYRRSETLDVTAARPRSRP
ncbi:MAG: DsbA family protein [Geminicoccaceae bacterium]